jgi:uncharacterized protein
MNLLEAIQKGDVNRASELIQEDPEIAGSRTTEGVSYVSVAMYHRQPEIARLLASKRPDLDLFEACSVGAADRVRDIVQEDPSSVNTYSPDGFPPVALAAFFGHIDILDILIQAGADVNAQARNPMQVAAIHAAVAAKDARGVEILLRNGADPNLQQQQGVTPMQAAIANTDSAIIQLLTAYGGR